MAARTSFSPVEGHNVFPASNFNNTTINFSDSKDPPPQPQVCRTIHFPHNEDSVERTAIAKELAILLPPRHDYQSAALWGLGGSGKTQLALEHAYDRCRDPACSVFWVHADTETSFTQDYGWIATKLGIANDLDGEKLLTAVRSHIEMPPLWVLVLDNADDLSLFGVGREQSSIGRDVPNLSTYIPRGTVGTVLWTSRDQRVAGSLVGPRRGINLVRMTVAESKALFQAVSVLEVAAGPEQDDLAQLVAEVKGLPLAITQAAAYFRRTKTSIADYLKKIRQRKKRWKVLKRSEHDPYRRPEVSNSVLETWNLLMEHIQQENKMAYDILTVLSYVDNQNIPFQMITEIVRAETDENSDSDGGSDTCEGSSRYSHCSAVPEAVLAIAKRTRMEAMMRMTSSRQLPDWKSSLF